MKRQTAILPAALAIGFLAALSVSTPAFAQSGSWTVAGTGSAAYAIVGGVRTDLVTATLPADGGVVSSDLVAGYVPGLLQSGCVTAVATGEGGSDLASAQTIASAADVNLLGGLITAARVIAVSSAVGGADVLESAAEGSGFTGLVVAGVSLGGDGDYTPAPNTRMNLPGVGYVILNEQVRGGSGARITVNMIHVVLQGILGTRTGEVVVGSATSAVGS